MAISHFLITKLPENVISRLALLPLQTDVLIPIAEEVTLNFARIASLDDYFVSEKVFFKVYDETLLQYGNETSFDVIWKESDLGVLPISADTQSLLANDAAPDLLSLLALNPATEFIQIVSYSGVLNLSIEGQIIVPGERIETSDLLKAVYKVHTNGGGVPYFTMTYKVGRGTVVEPTIYTLTIDVDAIAELTEISRVSTVLNEAFDDGAGGTINYDVTRETISIDITNGYQGGTAEVDISILSPFLVPSSPDAQSSVDIYFNGDNLEKIVDENFSIVVTLDDFGSATINIINIIVKDEASESGQVDINLISINQDIALVSATINTVSITTNI